MLMFLVLGLVSLEKLSCQVILKHEYFSTYRDQNLKYLPLPRKIKQELLGCYETRHPCPDVVKCEEESPGNCTDCCMFCGFIPFKRWPATIYSFCKTENRGETLREITQEGKRHFIERLRNGEFDDFEA